MALRRGVAAAVGLFAATAALVVVAPVHAPVARADASGAGGDFVPLPTPVRVLDTQRGIGAPAGPVGQQSTTSFQVGGQHGIPSVGVSAVLVDVATIDNSTGTFLMLWADGTDKPFGSMLNASTGETHSNSAVVPVGANGKVNVYNDVGTTNIAVDVQGYFLTNGVDGPGSGGFVPVTQTRVVDTRVPLGAPKEQIAAGGSLTVTLGRDPVPTTANAVFLSILIPSPPAAGVLNAFPAGGADNGSSVFDYAAGTGATGGVVKLGENGQVTFVNHSSSPINLILDVQGYFASDPTQGAGLHIAQNRLFDTAFVAPLRGGDTIDIAVAGAHGLPTRGIAGAALNFLTVQQQAGGSLRAWPLGEPEPATSIDNYTTGHPRAQQAIIKPGIDGKIRVHNLSSGATRLIVDLQGWFGDPPPSVPVEQFSPLAVMQDSLVRGELSGEIDYAYVDNAGKLMNVHQPDPINFDKVEFNPLSHSSFFTGRPAMAEQRDGLPQIVGHNTDSTMWAHTALQKNPTTWPSSGVPVGGSMASHATIATQSDGTLVVFAVDADGALWALPQDSANGPYTVWRNQGDVDLVGTPTALMVDGVIRLFAIDSAGTLKTALYSGGVSPWVDLGGSGLNGSVAVAVYPGPRLRIFVRDGDGAIVTKIQDVTGTFPSTWDTVPGFNAAGSPAAIFAPDSGLAEVVARGSDGKIYSTGETAQGSGVWRPWVPVPDADDAATDPTAYPFKDFAGDHWAFAYRKPDQTITVATADQPFGAIPPAFAVHALPTPPQ